MNAAKWIVRIDDNMDIKYSPENCAIIEAAFKQRKLEVPIVCNVSGWMEVWVHWRNVDCVSIVE